MSAGAEVPTSEKTPIIRLFLMMFLQIFIWGAWLPLIFGYLPTLGFTPFEQSWILNAFPIAAIIGLFFGNQFADRNFAAEKFLAFSHLVGGITMIGLSMTTDYWTFLTLMWVHCIFYVPTVSITNSIAFAHMRDPAAEFGPVRMGGTIGWIAAAWPFAFILVDWTAVQAAEPDGFIELIGTALGAGLTGDALRSATPWTFRVAGIASFALAAYALTLPHTPARKASGAGMDKLAWLEAARLLKHPFVLVLWIVALADSFVHNLFFNWAAVFFGSDVVGIPGNWIMPVMSIGQIAEILTMLVLGTVLKKLGWRTTMMVGVLAYVVRFGVYAWLPEFTWLVIAINFVHGVCYAFFFASVYIFVDACFPHDVRASAQGLFNVMILGVGALIANSVGPWLLQTVFTENGVTDFRSMFMIPILISILSALVLALGFRPPEKLAVKTVP
jgi:nucleoside transporter